MTQGRGTPRVLVPGWGMGPAAFAALSAELQTGCTVCRAPLPGDVLVDGGGVGRVADALLARVPVPAHWVGWSLGGLVALAAARRRPSAVERVTLLAAAPRMVAGPGWPAIEGADLEAFRAALRTDASAAHARFLGLQARGCERGRETLRALRRAVAEDGLPSIAELDGGLDVLMAADLRRGLGRLACPVDAVLGAHDALLPASVERPLRALGVRVRVLAGAGHAPQVSHPLAVAAELLESNR